jgi:hypothetical protein
VCVCAYMCVCVCVCVCVRGGGGWGALLGALCAALSVVCVYVCVPRVCGVRACVCVCVCMHACACACACVCICLCVGGGYVSGWRARGAPLHCSPVGCFFLKKHTATDTARRSAGRWTCSARATHAHTRTHTHTHHRCHHTERARAHTHTHTQKKGCSKKCFPNLSSSASSASSRKRVILFQYRSILCPDTPSGSAPRTIDCTFFNDTSFALYDTFKVPHDTIYDKPTNKQRYRYYIYIIVYRLILYDDTVSHDTIFVLFDQKIGDPSGIRTSDLRLQNHQTNHYAKLQPVLFFHQGVLYS